MRQIENLSKKKWLTVEQAAEKLRLSESTIRTYAGAGKIGSTKAGHRLLIDLMELKSPAGYKPRWMRKILQVGMQRTTDEPPVEKPNPRFQDGPVQVIGKIW